MEERHDQSKALAFEDLLIQMLNLGVDDRLATSYDVQDILNSQGWNVEQVSKVWTVGPDIAYSSAWDTQSLERLGGKKILSKVWESLKGMRLTGHHKRSAQEEKSTACSKKRKLCRGGRQKSKGISVSSEIGSQKENAHELNIPSNGNPTVQHQNPKDCILDRIPRKALRRSKQTLKLTDWLIPSPIRSQPSQQKETPKSAPNKGKKAPNSAQASHFSSKSAAKRKKNPQRRSKDPTFPQPDFSTQVEKADYLSNIPTPTKPIPVQEPKKSPALNSTAPTLLAGTPSRTESCVPSKAKKLQQGFDCSSPVLRQRAASTLAAGGRYGTTYQPRPTTGNGSSSSCPNLKKKTDGASL